MSQSLVLIDSLCGQQLQPSQHGTDCRKTILIGLLDSNHGLTAFIFVEPGRFDTNMGLTCSRPISRIFSRLIWSGTSLGDPVERYAFGGCPRQMSYFGRKPPQINLVSRRLATCGNAPRPWGEGGESCLIRKASCCAED